MNTESLHKQKKHVQNLVLNMIPKRVMYCSGGPANLIDAHKSWRAKLHDPTEVSVTFSSQIQSACEQKKCSTYMISPRGHAEIISDGLFVIEHRNKSKARGLQFHINEVRYFFGLLKTAINFKADIIFVDSGTCHFFLLGFFRLFGVEVVPILHNTLWPTGFFPEKLSRRMVLLLDKILFWSWVPKALISVSPECERQVKRLIPSPKFELIQVRAQFDINFFKGIPEPSFPLNGPFHILFVGRIERVKGVFDILSIAEIINAVVPNKVKWIICGTGSDFSELQHTLHKKRLHDSVTLNGWTSLETLRGIYATAHACIVPTRSEFNEALAMTAVESILAGRPLISNSLVPATELLMPACVMGRVDDPMSHAKAVLSLINSPDLYLEKVNSCKVLGGEFIDKKWGLESTVIRIIDDVT